MIPEIDFKALLARDKDTMLKVRDASRDIGFLTLSNTSFSDDEVVQALQAYRKFFKSSDINKQNVDMSQTGSNRGWGAPKSEQVDPDSNPDFKEVFDCGVEVPKGDPQAHLSVYAANQWPSEPEDFQKTIESYFSKARLVALELLRGISDAIEADTDFFADKFYKPMALLRGNFYPERPNDATDKDFGIAPHTDYGCLTLLATDGQPGLEVQILEGQWIPVAAEPGTFIVNFGEMLEMWTDKKIRATNHRVVGGTNERISIPLFFNPNYDTNVAAKNAESISAGEYLSKRYNETYAHLQDKA